MGVDNSTFGAEKTQPAVWMNVRLHRTYFRAGDQAEGDGRPEPGRIRVKLPELCFLSGRGGNNQLAAFPMFDRRLTTKFVEHRPATKAEFRPKRVGRIVDALPERQR